MVNWGTFFIGVGVGFTLGFLLWTESGKIVTGYTKEKLKSELRERLTTLEKT